MKNKASKSKTSPKTISFKEVEQLYVDHFNKHAWVRPKCKHSGEIDAHGNNFHFDSESEETKSRAMYEIFFEMMEDKKPILASEYKKWIKEYAVK